MRRYVVFLELVSESHWAIEKSGLDKVNKTRIEIDLDIGDGVPRHPDRLKENDESASLTE